MLFPGSHKPLTVRSGKSNRFFAQDMLAGLQSLDGPFDVHVVRQRVVDGVHVRISKQVFIGTVESGNSEFASLGFCTPPVA